MYPVLPWYPFPPQSNLTKHASKSYYASIFFFSEWQEIPLEFFKIKSQVYNVNKSYIFYCKTIEMPRIKDDRNLLNMQLFIKDPLTKKLKVHNNANEKSQKWKEHLKIQFQKLQPILKKKKKSRILAKTLAVNLKQRSYIISRLHSNISHDYLLGAELGTFICFRFWLHPLLATIYLLSTTITFVTGSELK